jgi:hypothetical protein
MLSILSVALLGCLASPALAQTCAHCENDGFEPPLAHRYNYTTPPPLLEWDDSDGHSDWRAGSCQANHEMCDLLARFEGRHQAGESLERLEHSLMYALVASNGILTFNRQTRRVDSLRCGDTVAALHSARLAGIHVAMALDLHLTDHAHSMP